METTRSGSDIEAALLAFMAERGLSRDAAIDAILREWLASNSYLKEASSGLVEPSRPDSEEVQYPGYFDGGNL